MGTRRARQTFTNELLIKRLNLPEDAMVYGIQFDTYRNVYHVDYISASAPEVPEAAEHPTLFEAI